MSRTAEYSIRGYLYQFLRYLSEILAAAPGTQISIEGVVEDVDVVSSDATTAIQCKLHEQADKFTLGKIYKPVLQMLEHFGNKAPGDPEIEYRLFCHFPDKTGTMHLSMEDLATIEGTNAEPLKAIIARIPVSTDRAAFLAHLSIEFGPRLDDLEQEVLVALAAKGFSADDIETLIYPNAVQRIVNLATRQRIEDRTVDAGTFVQSLSDTRQATFTRWTLALKTRGQVLKKLRDDLKHSLSENSRSRFFVIGVGINAAFDAEVASFIKKFVERYSVKYLHDNPPLFILTDRRKIGTLSEQLHDQGIPCTTGDVGGGAFRAERLLRRPMRGRKPVTHEFRVRLAARDDLGELPRPRPDDLILINISDDPWDCPGTTNVYRIQAEQMSEIEYAFQLRKEYV